MVLQAQEYVVTGNVKDVDSATIPFSNVLLLSAKDSTFVQGTLADEEGKFVLEGVKKGAYFLKAIYLGQMSKLLPIDVLKDTHVPKLQIREITQKLDEVVVTSRKPNVRKKEGKLIFEVENSIVSSGTSWDVLNKTPGVINSNNELQVRNQAATVYINGRKMHLSNDEVQEFLENYAGSNIKSIEVQANAKADQDAESGPIINIVTSKSVAFGYKGSVGGYYRQGEQFPKFNGNTAHYFKSEKTHLFLNYSFSPKTEFITAEDKTYFLNESNNPYSQWDTKFDREIQSNTHNITAIFDYQINDNNKLNITALSMLAPNTTYDNFQRSNITNASGVLDSIFTTKNDIGQDKFNSSADVTFRHNFPKNGGWKWNAHFTQFNMDRVQDVRSRYNNIGEDTTRNFDFYTESRQAITIYTSQLDIDTNIGNADIRVGAKAAIIDSESQLDFYNGAAGTRVFNSSLSDLFAYDEQVYAAYVKMSKAWGKWSIDAGLRTEYTLSEGQSQHAINNNKLEYTEWFPSATLSYVPNDNHSFSLNYGRKLRRPRYEDLNPFRYFINENNFLEGNPRLRPNFSNELTLSYGLKEQYFVDFYYRDNGNYITAVSFADNQAQVLKTIRQNVLGSTSFGVDLYHGRSITNWWYANFYVSIFHEDETFLAIESIEEKYRNEYDGWYVDISNSFTLSKDGTLTGDLGFSYLSGYLQSSFLQEETIGLNLGLQKTFWNKRASLSFKANDILNKQNATITAKYYNQHFRMYNLPETRWFQLSFKYKFGNFRLRDNMRGINKSETDRLK